MTHHFVPCSEVDEWVARYDRMKAQRDKALEALGNAERLLAAVVDVSPRLDGSVSRGEWADLEVALAEIRRVER